MAEYKVGERLRSRVSTVQVVVVRAGKGDADIACDGVVLVRDGEDLVPASGGPSDGAKVDMGKRYEDADGTVEVLCVSPGAGRLSLGDRPLQLKAPKPLPASD
ncbi:hypothetical protein [Rhodococcoides kyotonense]|uniref:Uncharacterized protein n=1 Tax=Rhodococcoides kyotonense TaxID=398843 RepID=A0A239M346_9NOCA|nr:hypothetical protein [Rhodococcus kyotonensis]SNT36712.1 hypothetical protein SAMN05421642_115109 [Rhodococcus kyotonensis]